MGGFGRVSAQLEADLLFLRPLVGPVCARSVWWRLAKRSAKTPSMFAHVDRLTHRLIESAARGGRYSSCSLRCRDLPGVFLCLSPPMASEK